MKIRHEAIRSSKHWSALHLTYIFGCCFQINYHHKGEIFFVFKIFFICFEDFVLKAINKTGVTCTTFNVFSVFFLTSKKHITIVTLKSFFLLGFLTLIIIGNKSRFRINGKIIIITVFFSYRTINKNIDRNKILQYTYNKHTIELSWNTQSQFQFSGAFSLVGLVQSSRLFLNNINLHKNSIRYSSIINHMQFIFKMGTFFRII